MLGCALIRISGNLIDVRLARNNNTAVISRIRFASNVLAAVRRRCRMSGRHVVGKARRKPYLTLHMLPMHT